MIFAKNFARNFEKKEKVLRTSFSLSMSRSSQRTSDPAYYIEDCRISDGCCSRSCRVQRRANRN